MASFIWLLSNVNARSMSSNSSRCDSVNVRSTSTRWRRERQISLVTELFIYFILLIIDINRITIYFMLYQKVQRKKKLFWLGLTNTYPTSTSSKCRFLFTFRASVGWQGRWNPSKIAHCILQFVRRSQYAQVPYILVLLKYHYYCKKILPSTSCDHNVWFCSPSL